MSSQVTKDTDEYDATMEYVTITEHEHNTKYDHNNIVKSVAMFRAKSVAKILARIAVMLQARRQNSNKPSKYGGYREICTQSGTYIQYLIEYTNLAPNQTLYGIGS